MLKVSKLKERYLKIAKEDGINEQELKSIEYVLGLTLPEDFKKISQFFSGGCLGTVENYSFIQGKWKCPNQSLEPADNGIQDLAQ